MIEKLEEKKNAIRITRAGIDIRKISLYSIGKYKNKKKKKKGNKMKKK